MVAKNNILIERRSGLGWSQAQLAQLLGCSRVFICDIENGKRRPSVETLRRLAEVLDLSDAEIAQLVRGVA